VSNTLAIGRLSIVITFTRLLQTLGAIVSDISRFCAPGLFRFDDILRLSDLVRPSLDVPNTAEDTSSMWRNVCHGRV